MIKIVAPVIVIAHDLIATIQVYFVIFNFYCVMICYGVRSNRFICIGNQSKHSVYYWKYASYLNTITCGTKTNVRKREPDYGFLNYSLTYIFAKVVVIEYIVQIRVENVYGIFRSNTQSFNTHRFSFYSARLQDWIHVGSHRFGCQLL